MSNPARPPHPRSTAPAPTRREFLQRIAWSAAALAGAARLSPRAIAADAAASAAGARPLGVALVGLGRYSTGQLAPALKLTSHCRLAGVVTGSPEKGAQWAAEHGFPASSVYGYDTMHRLADNRDIDIVYVVTPNGLHAEHAIKAAEAGKHVIVEKPMANTVAECDAIIAACRRAKRQLSIGYRLHYDPYHLELKKLGREKEFGPLLKMTGDRSFTLRPGAWRADKKLAGGGPLMDLGVYIIQAACMAAGEVLPVGVTAKEEPKTRPEVFPEVEEALRWTMEFPGGEVCEGLTGYTVPGHDTFRAEGPKGWIDFKKSAFTYRGAVVETSRGPLSFPPFNQQAAQMDAFAECVRADRASIVPGEMGRRDLQIIEAIYRAMHSGKREQV